MSERVEITPGKERALQQSLDAGHKVTLKNGATLKRRSKNEGIVVRRKYGRGGVERSFGTHAYGKAFDYALNGPDEPRRSAPIRKIKRRPHPEWEECPF